MSEHYRQENSGNQSQIAPPPIVKKGKREQMEDHCKENAEGIWMV